METSTNGANTQQIGLQVPLDGRLLQVIEEMARYYNQTPEQFIVESLESHVAGILDNPRILGETLTAKLKTLVVAG